MICVRDYSAKNYNYPFFHIINIDIFTNAQILIDCNDNINIISLREKKSVKKIPKIGIEGILIFYW